MQTRLKDNITKPKEFTDGTIRYSRAFITSVEPTSHLVALKDPSWKQAMDNEFNALIKNETWKLVPPQPRMNIIDCKWVFKIKRKADGSIDRHKARLVARVLSSVMELIMRTRSHLEEIHMTWAHLEKKQTRQRLYTNSLEENTNSVWRRHRQFSQRRQDYQETVSGFLRRRQNIATSKETLEDSMAGWRQDCCEAAAVYFSIYTHAY
ncbi:retrotransposon protein, putative, ty1-copia subclass [Tanacetum coccineum]|uniref:Retrotransposon protein, putative, ty1-copia subclass n=1 Tax=Tanacetum coccineum TaxID=301880 RepID=A0ABQ5CBA6_9ASTR